MANSPLFLIPDELENSKTAYAAICGAGRSLGYVNAPSLSQRVAAKCAGQIADIPIYEKSRNLLYDLFSFTYLSGETVQQYSETMKKPAAEQVKK